MNRATLELEMHLRRIERGNRDDRVWMESERLDLLESLCIIASRHLSIASDAAFLRDREVLDAHLRHGVEGIKLVVKIFKLLPPADANETKPGDAATKHTGGRFNDGQ